jgi:hypothetical protein
MRLTLLHSHPAATAVPLPSYGSEWVGPGGPPGANLRGARLEPVMAAFACCPLRLARRLKRR